MIRKSLAAFLVLSWIIFSGVDILEDLSFQADITIYTTPVSRLPVGHKAVKLANDTVEFAHYNTLFFGKVPKDTNLESATCQFSSNTYLDSKVSRSHKDNRVLLI